MTHPKLSILASAIHSILNPLGFKKYKLVWKRFGQEMTQLVCLDKQTYGFHVYNFCYGICVAKFSEATKAGRFDPNVEWHIGVQVRGKTERERIPERRRIFAAFDLTNDATDANRAAVIEELLKSYVIPTFDATDSTEKLRHVLRDFSNPFSTINVNFERDKL